MPPPPPPQSPKRKMPGGWGRASSLTALIVYLIANLVLSFFNEGDEPTISYTEFSKQVANDNVTKIYAKGDAIQGQLKQLSSPPRTTAAARPTTTRSSRRSARPSPTTTSGRTWRSTTSP
ncbi:ATP-dependent metallopeptidase FtsH/Yme1/Tma family protein [Streptomyces sp. KL116D]|uniref:ATP-dependent metallopeptidase FtsH/Yme1/Tma family protein n=1 Tax=Streptomyces sp. KL116D TaxID=3045152 RepID=UPI0035575392